MTTRYVAIDTETTGLDSDQDEIIEVAAIAFDLSNGLGEYNTLVRPRQKLPYQIERLTGIEAAELASAPSVSDIANDLADFIGNSVIVGQSIAFDIDFLTRAGIAAPGQVVDTWDMAQLLLPGLGNYSLRSIAEHLGIDFPVRHRARADADAARSVFLALRSRLQQLQSGVLQELDRLAEAGEWSVGVAIREVLDSTEGGSGSPAPLTTGVLATPEEIGRALSSGVDTKVDLSESSELLSQASELTEHFPDFERRPEQEKMTAAVAQALGEGHHLIVEAGTGTGKSLAYLAPAALQALRSGERVVISTDTIGLQEQLIEKDLPVVQELIAKRETEPLRVASLKGRRNYLCLQRWTAARHTGPLSKEDARLQARLLLWLSSTQTGDRSELGLHSSFDEAWGKLSAENTACIQTSCSFVRDGTCFLLRARRRAEAAHVLVVNHALLLSDVATGGHVLPPFEHLVIDEAHNLEDEATTRFAFKGTEGNVLDFLDRIGRKGSERAGLVGALNDAMRGTPGILASEAFLSSLASALLAAAAKARARTTEPFGFLAQILSDFSADRASSDRLLITRAIRVQALWSDVEISAENLDATLKDVLTGLENLRDLLESGDQGLLNQDAVTAEAADVYQIGNELRDGLQRALLADDSSLICWLERSRFSGELAVSTAPLEVAEILNQQIFETKESVILTSATLSTEENFAYLRQRIGLEDAEELLLGSPFDYANSTLIALPTDLPEPNASDFPQVTGQLLVEACRASQGRALLLFTSYGVLNAVYNEIKAPLEAEGILVLGHGIDGSPRQMLAALRENPRTVILGTASFWEGVDLAGEALSLLVIVRLPFAVPTDPIYQARSALYDQPFEEYALPQAILRFRQGFGRLIRTKTDRGVLIVLDRRITGRRYGESFLRSLPRCTVRELASRDVPGAVEGWLS